MNQRDNFIIFWKGIIRSCLSVRPPRGEVGTRCQPANIKACKSIDFCRIENFLMAIALSFRDITTILDTKVLESFVKKRVVQRQTPPNYRPPISLLTIKENH